MAETRFNSDECRITKKLQQMTDQGRYMLNAPGNGDKPCYVADPQIILQKWGGNLRTNSVNLESELMGVNRPLGKDCLGKDNYKIMNSNQNQFNILFVQIYTQNKVGLLCLHGLQETWSK